MFELDHFFICTAAGAPEAQQLIEFGLTEGPANVHPGQGTACRRFFFHNAMLELLWVDDVEQPQSEQLQRLQLTRRWRRRRADASPFGLCFRPSGSQIGDLPFPSWEYRGAYLPNSMVIHVGKDSNLGEPMLFFIGFGNRPDSAEPTRQPPMDHPAGLQEITAVTISFPRERDVSPTLDAAAATGAFVIGTADEHLLEVSFDNQATGKSNDFRPALPLVFRW